MLELWILRHAKSDWNADYEADHERPLNRRGERASEVLGEFLARRRLAPERILCSTAARARRTVEIASEAAGWRCPVHHTRDLYEATAPAVLDEIRRHDDGASPLMVAGHQPTSAELASHLIGGGRLRLPTCGLIAVGFDIERWSALRFGIGELRWMTIPRLREETSKG